MDLYANFYHILFMLGVFVACILVLQKLVFKPTLALLAERQKRLAGMEREAKLFQDQAQKKLEDYTQLMNEARHQARRAREEILKSAENEHKALIEEARKASEGRIQKAKAEIASQTLKAKEDLLQASQELAQSIVNKILPQKVA